MTPEVREAVRQSRYYETKAWETLHRMGRCLYGLEPWPSTVPTVPPPPAELEEV